MRDRARDVFVALTGVETGSTTLEAFEDVFNNDFSAWRVFFRAVKDLTADNESALAELSGGGFLVGMFNTPRAGLARARSTIVPSGSFLQPRVCPFACAESLVDTSLML